jgi:hypothetical protein
MASRPVTPRPLVGRRRLRGTERRGAQGLEVAQALARPAQLDRLGLRGIGRLDLLQLEGEQVELALAGPGAFAQLGQGRLELADPRVDRREVGPARQVRRAAEAVEDLELRGGQRQLAVLVLAVERQQRDRHLAQVADRRRTPAQVGARAPLGAHAPGEDDLLGVGRQALAQLAAQRRRQLEHPFHVGLSRPGAHDAGARAAAQEEVERVREHRLARARLAGEHVEARGEAQLGPFDEEEVLDAQLQEHDTASTSGGRRTAGLRPLAAHALCEGARNPCATARVS